MDTIEPSKKDLDRIRYVQERMAQHELDRQALGMALQGIMNELLLKHGASGTYELRGDVFVKVEIKKDEQGTAEKEAAKVPELPKEVSDNQSN